ncbi:hypothetical protein LFYK43_20440 [Ligilactobacillus salitolerans]|uniref:Uncharacterized protein n=1 Tax=Ligilactobacillus salitolerans TaxID=1808352 RepID=A0A401IVQ0_9LACO|nr:hypothetical protein LFYK43_20440 [Ligilactobacillus salitolerans]
MLSQIQTQPLVLNWTGFFKRPTAINSRTILLSKLIDIQHSNLIKAMFPRTRQWDGAETWQQKNTI